MKTMKTHRFTLVELLVSMAVLVVMVGFMFEFVSGAQRIWTSSSGSTSLFEQSELIFNYVGTDLKNAQSESVLGEKVPFYYASSIEGTNGQDPTSTGGPNGGVVTDGEASDLSFVTRTADGKALPVKYFFIKSNGDDKVFKLYRNCFEESFDYQQGAEAFGSLEVEDWESMVPLAENVYDFRIEALARNSDGNPYPVTEYASDYPYAVRVTVKLFDPNQIPDYENKSLADLESNASGDETVYVRYIDEYLHTFTKIFLLK